MAKIEDVLKFACRGKAGATERVAVRVSAPFRGSRFEAGDDYGGVETGIVSIDVAGRPQLPFGVSIETRCFARGVKNNLLSFNECPAGREVIVFVHFLKDGAWWGELHRASKDDGKYVDGLSLWNEMMR